jgi:hypothetical protein
MRWFWACVFAREQIAQDYLHAGDEVYGALDAACVAARKDASDKLLRRQEQLYWFRMLSSTALAANGQLDDADRLQTIGLKSSTGKMLLGGGNNNNKILDEIPVFMDRILNPFSR